MNYAIRHGEILLQPVNEIPKGKIVKAKNYIVGHSETGHHHVLESDVDFTVLEAENMNDQLFFQLIKPAKMVHKKSTDKHKTLTIPAGIYKRFHDTEYDPFEKVIREVAD